MSVVLLVGYGVVQQLGLLCDLTFFIKVGCVYCKWGLGGWVGGCVGGLISKGMTPTIPLVQLRQTSRRAV